jgi:hypothetical protein
VLSNDKYIISIAYTRFEPKDNVFIENDDNVFATILIRNDELAILSRY